MSTLTNNPNLLRLRVTISGVLHNGNDSWKILAATDEDGDELKAVGGMSSAQTGDVAVLHGNWVTHPRYGKQFKFVSYEPDLPADAEAAEAYLASGRIPGLGKVTAKKIVKHFGDQALIILDEDIERLDEVPGIAKKTREKIAAGWAQTAAPRHIAIALTSLGAPGGLADAIYDQFGVDGATLIRENPFALTVVRGIGFQTCDGIANRLQWSRTDPRRLSAGLEYTLEQAESSGHCYLPVTDLLAEAADLLDVHSSHLTEAIGLALEENRIIIDEDRAYTARLYRIETDLADELVRLVDAKVSPIAEDDRLEIDKLLEQQHLTEQQREGVEAVLKHPVTVMTGGPGVGKSHTVASVVRVGDVVGWRTVLCAPTGRAAQRMSELADGAPAQTVHRLIGLGKSGHSEDEESEADGLSGVDLVVCDESSMLDAWLAWRLVEAIETGTRVLFVGDIDQLPSVGPGRVLGDLIDSRAIPTVCLTQIFRQAAESGIVQVAHAINAGQQPSLSGWEDLYYWKLTDSPARPEGVPSIAEGALDMVCNLIPARFDIPSRDIQVLTPKRGGSCGTIALNQQLQAAINPEGEQYEATIGSTRTIYRVGDRAMIIKNNYDKGANGVFNGTPVRVVAVNPDGGDNAVTVATEEGERITYKAKEISELMLSYAITIHKSQGSQYPCVVIPVSNQAHHMLVRNLIYTAITRARQLVVLVGERSAIAKAVATEDAVRRKSGLAPRIANGTEFPEKN